jgi:hypothetical protein
MTPSSPAAASELMAILLREHESKDRDYKAASEWNERDKVACRGIVKDILAMATAGNDCADRCAGG